MNALAEYGELITGQTKANDGDRVVTTVRLTLPRAINQRDFRLVSVVEFRYDDSGFPEGGSSHYK
jgi:hypothetical protein